MIVACGAEAERRIPFLASSLLFSTNGPTEHVTDSRSGEETENYDFMEKQASAGDGPPRVNWN